VSADALIREIFEYWPAWADLVEWVSTEDPRTADPHSIFGAACGCERDRLAARLYGGGHGNSLEEAAELLELILDMAEQGKRPRYGRELGLTAEHFGVES
jgi:hypothetical protein